MADHWDQKAFNEFLKLRDELKEAKRAKNHLDIIAMCDAILELEKRAKFIQIFTPLFHKELGSAYMSLNELQKAADHFDLAKAGYFEQRTKSLNKPDDWLKDIGICEKKLALVQALQQKASA